MKQQTNAHRWSLRLLIAGLVILNLFLALHTLQTVATVIEDLGDGIRGHGALRVENTTLTDSHGNAIQLRGMSTHGIMWYPEYTNAGAFQTVREYGGNVIRLAFMTLIKTHHYKGELNGCQ